MPYEVLVQTEMSAYNISCIQVYRYPFQYCFVWYSTRKAGSISKAEREVDAVMFIACGPVGDRFATPLSFLAP